MSDPAVHQASYEFADRAQSRHERRSAQDIGRDFNRDWPDVTRTRETFVLAEEFAAG